MAIDPYKDVKATAIEAFSRVESSAPAGVFDFGDILPVTAEAICRSSSADSILEIYVRSILRFSSACLGSS